MLFSVYAFIPNRTRRDDEPDDGTAQRRSDRKEG
jgi:hypothetical protein